MKEEYRLPDGFVDFTFSADTKIAKINIGTGQTVEIEKLFGPACFDNIRITPDTTSYSYIVERKTFVEDADGNDVSKWILIMKIPATED